jgi:hypothetical protein
MVLKKSKGGLVLEAYAAMLAFTQRLTRAVSVCVSPIVFGVRVSHRAARVEPTNKEAAIMQQITKKLFICGATVLEELK